MKKVLVLTSMLVVGLMTTAYSANQDARKQAAARVFVGRSFQSCTSTIQQFIEQNLDQLVPPESMSETPFTSEVWDRLSRLKSNPARNQLRTINEQEREKWKEQTRENMAKLSQRGVHLQIGGAVVTVGAIAAIFGVCKFYGIAVKELSGALPTIDEFDSEDEFTAKVAAIKKARRWAIGLGVLSATGPIMAIVGTLNKFDAWFNLSQLDL